MWATENVPQVSPLLFRDEGLLVPSKGATSYKYDSDLLAFIRFTVCEKVHGLHNSTKIADAN